MKRLFFAIGLASLGFCAPTSAQNYYWSIGPAISLDCYQVNLPNGVIGAIIDNPVALSYGLDVSFTAHRLLISTKLLTSQRKYHYTQGYPINSDPDDVSYLTVSAQPFIVPLTLSYRLFSSPRLSFFAGGGAVGEWLPNGYTGRVTNEERTPLPGRSFQADSEQELQLGVTAQVVFRYHLTNKLLISVEPSYRRFTSIGVPLGYTNKHAFSGLFSLSHKL